MLQASNKIYNNFLALKAAFLDFNYSHLYNYTTQDEFGMIDGYQCLG